ncbi:MAG: phosphatase PAP2 family protein [Phocaeicola sp.]|uniref:phosphatase PAP2 family protein n=1 Tax=Phocaeicola sp. TaxID=2773926 RepID=UPI003FA087D1
MKEVRLFMLCTVLMTMVQVCAQNADVNVAERINSWDVHGLSKTLSASALVIPAGLPTAMAVVALINEDKALLRDAVYIGTAVVEAVGISYSLKQLTNRRRPYDAYPDKIASYGHISHRSSLPSDHTAAAFSLATAISIKYPKWYVIASSAVWASGVGLARINQGAHYPSDVLVGAAIGIGCGMVNVYINKWLNKVLFKE